MARGISLPQDQADESNECRDALPRLLGVTCSDLILVGGECCQDFVLLTLRNFKVVQRPSEFRCDLIEFRRRYLEVPMCLFKAERRLARLGSRELERPARNIANPQRPHELEAGQPSQVLGVPFPQLRVLGTSRQQSGSSLRRR